MKMFIGCIVVLACVGCYKSTHDVAPGCSENDFKSYNGSIRVVHPQDSQHNRLERGRSSVPLTEWEVCGGVAYWSGCELREGVETVCDGWVFFDVVVMDNGNVYAAVDAEEARFPGTVELNSQ